MCQTEAELHSVQQQATGSRPAHRKSRQHALLKMYHAPLRSTESKTKPTPASAGSLERLRPPPLQPQPLRVGSWHTLQKCRGSSGAPGLCRSTVAIKGTCIYGFNRNQ
jgi:hypothetical protein